MRVLLLTLLLAACSAPATVPPGDPPSVTVEDELALARAKWADADLQSYELTISRSCFCPPEWRGPYTVTVQGGETTSVMYDGRSVEMEAPPSVEELFALLETAYTNGAVRVDVTYHEDWGYPLSLYIDRDEMIADEEIGYQISELIRR